MPHPWKSWNGGAPRHGSAPGSAGDDAQGEVGAFISPAAGAGKNSPAFGHRSSSPCPSFLIISADLAQLLPLPTGPCLHYILGSALGKHLEEQPSHPRGDFGMAGAAASPQTFSCSAVPASSTARGQGTGDVLVWVLARLCTSPFKVWDGKTGKAVPVMRIGWDGSSRWPRDTRAERRG